MDQGKLKLDKPEKTVAGTFPADAYMYVSLAEQVPEFWGI
jgi:hypothetical protein